MQKEISNQLIEVEILGHEKVKTTDIGEVDSTHLKNYRSQEGNEVDNQQILCNGGYAKHVCNLQFDNLRFTIYDSAQWLFCTIWAQNYEKYLVFRLK